MTGTFFYYIILRISFSFNQVNKEYTLIRNQHLFTPNEPSKTAFKKRTRQNQLSAYTAEWIIIFVRRLT